MSSQQIETKTLVVDPLVTIKFSELKQWRDKLDGIIAMEQLGMHSNTIAYGQQLLVQINAVVESNRPKPSQQ